MTRPIPPDADVRFSRMLSALPYTRRTMPPRGARRSWAAVLAMATAALTAPSAIRAQTNPSLAVPAEEPDRALADTPAVAPVRDFRDAVELTVTTDPGYLAQRAQARAGQYRVDQARAAFGPTIDVAVTGRIARHRLQYDLGFVLKNRWSSWSQQAVLTQPLFTSGRLTGDLRAAQADTEYRAQIQRYGENQALFAAATSYVGVLRDRAIVQIAQRNQEMLGMQDSDGRRRFEVRENTAVDVNQIGARYAAAQASLLNAQARLTATEAAFRRDIGADAGELAQMPEVGALLPETLDEALAIAERESPLLLAARARERQSRARITTARSEFGPQVNLQAVAGHFGREPQAGIASQTVLEGLLVANVPLYSSGASLARIREAEALNDSDQRLVDQTMRDQHAEIVSRWAQYGAALASLEKLTAAAEKAGIAYSGASKQQRAGMVTTLDLLSLLQDLLSYRSQLVQAEADAEISRFGLLAAMGRLSVNNLLPDERLRADEPRLRRLPGVLALPLGPLANLADGLFTADPGKVPSSRDPAARLKPAPALPLPAEANRRAITVGKY